MKYFTVMHGLRGCYMPDGDPYVVACKTRRELKDVVQSQASMLDSGHTFGFSQRAIASFAAQCWSEAKKDKPAFLPFALPYKEAGESVYHSAIFVSVTSRQDYLEYIKTD